MARRDNHQAARALADWARTGFGRSTERQIADTHGVSTRTLWRWKDALDDDPELSALFRDLLNALMDGDWVAHLDAALMELTEIIRAKAKEPEASLMMVTDAFRALSDVVMTREVFALDDGDASSDQSRAPAETAAHGQAAHLN